MTWKSKVSRVKVKGHIGLGQRSHGSGSKVIGQGQIWAFYTVRLLISPSETDRWAHINVKLLHLEHVFAQITMKLMETINLLPEKHAFISKYMYRKPWMEPTNLDGQGSELTA